MEFQQYIAIVRRRLWLILLLMLLSGAGAFTYTLLRPTEYQSTTTLLLNPAVPSELVPYLQVQAASSLADSYGEYMRSTAFAQQVSKEVGYNIDAEQMKSIISTRLVPNTMFFKILAHSTDPAQAQSLASIAARIFIASNSGQQPSEKQVNNDKLRSSLEADLDYYSREEQDYHGQIKKLEAETTSSQRDAQLASLRSQLLLIQNAKADTLRSLTQLISTTPNSQQGAIVVDTAQPGMPLPDHMLELILLAILAALVLGVALALGLEYMDYTIHTPEQFDSLLKIPAIGVVGKFKVKRGKDADGVPQASRQSLITLSQPRSPFSEAYRTIRTNLQFSSVDRPLRVILITSAIPNEGKSVTAANLAVVMAQAGKRVVLMDADLRRPSQHRIFGLENRTGLTNIILNPSSAPVEVVHSIAEVPNLSVITAGPLPPNPAELLNSRYTEQIVRAMAGRCDVVIIDSPPAVAVTDPLVLARYADAAVIVVRAGHTRRDLIQKLCASLATAGVRVVAPILNAATTGMGNSYYEYYTPNNQMTLTQNLLTAALPDNLTANRGGDEHEAVVLDQAQPLRRRETGRLRPSMTNPRRRRN